MIIYRFEYNYYNRFDLKNAKPETSFHSHTTDLTG